MVRPSTAGSCEFENIGSLCRVMALDDYRNDYNYCL